MPRPNATLLVAAGILTLLLVLLSFGFYPPEIGNSRAQDVSLLAGLAVTGCFVASAFAARVLRYADENLRRAIVIAGCVFGLGTFAFITLMSIYTEVDPETSTRVPVGLTYSNDFLTLLPSNGGNYATTKEDLEYDPSRIYQPWSVYAAKAILLGAWSMLFASGSYFGTALGRLQKLQRGVVEFTVQQGGETLSSQSTSRGGLERTIRDRIPQLNMAVWRERTTEIEGQVCRIEFDGNAAGTAFLVGPDVVLTNYHVVEALLNNLVDWSRVAARFDYKVLKTHERASGTIVGLHPTAWNLDFSPYADCDTRNNGPELPSVDELDYALLRLEKSIGLDEFVPGDSLKPRRRGWLSLPDRLPPLSAKSPLIIVQHPDGAPLKLAIDTEAFLGFNANQNRMRYTTNTEPGSSGSPVFDFEWNLVALHHLGDPAVGKLSAEFNQGVPVNAIRRRIVEPSRPNSEQRISAISPTA
jgi:hypothetical protein